ncbi:MAG: hypothetical protein GY816_16280 [Cytophagales bacterium]|nr:hypothetical protein [Cytophagales bacterium]
MKIRKEHRENKPQFSKHDLEIYERISRQCKENNITPIYVYPPKKHRLLGLFKKLPDVNKIDLSDPRKYPEFYSIKNSFDKKHFNGAGATLYSVELAKKLAEIIE